MKIIKIFFDNLLIYFLLNYELEYYLIHLIKCFISLFIINSYFNILFYLFNNSFSLLLI